MPELHGSAVQRNIYPAGHTGAPFATMKGAVTLGGKIATAFTESKWIASEESRERAEDLQPFDAKEFAQAFIEE